MTSPIDRGHVFTPLRMLCAVGILAIVVLAVSGVNPVGIVALCAVTVLFDWLVSPVILQRVLRTRLVPNDGHGYLAYPGSQEDRVGGILARRCQATGLPLVRLEIADVDEPNAFTYGRSARNPRVVVTTGLLRRLSDDELDAVVCHELGHVHHRDVVLMTTLSAIPALCYFAFRMFLSMDDDANDDDEGGGAIFAIGFLLVYVLTGFLLFAVSRSREYEADRWALGQIGRAEPLVDALIAVSHGVGETREAVDQRREEIRSLPPKQRRAARRELRPATSTAMVNAMALANPTNRDSNAVPRAESGEDRRQLFEDADRMTRFLDLFATHPPLRRRVGAIHGHAANCRSDRSPLEAPK